MDGDMGRSSLVRLTKLKSHGKHVKSMYGEILRLPQRFSQFSGVRGVAVTQLGCEWIRSEVLSRLSLVLL